MRHGIKRSKRNRSPRRRLDLTAMREALATGEVWTVLGVVSKGDRASHWELYEDDLLIEVETVPDGELLSCRMGSLAGGANYGVWAIPPLGTEVVVVVPRGDYTFSPCIVATLSSGDLPDGIAEGVTVVANAEVLIHDGDGGTQKLVTKDDYDALKANFDGHKHAGLLGGSGSALALTTSPQDPLGDADPLPEMIGTQVLKAK